MEFELFSVEIQTEHETQKESVTSVFRIMELAKKQILYPVLLLFISALYPKFYSACIYAICAISWHGHILLIDSYWTTLHTIFEPDVQKGR